MKKVVWIYSINASGVAPIGYVGPVVDSYILPRFKEFQENLKTELLPEVELSFISYDMEDPEVPPADLVIYNDNDGKYLDEATKKTAFGIPYQDFLSMDIEKIKPIIEAHL